MSRHLPWLAAVLWPATVAGTMYALAGARFEACLIGGALGGLFAAAGTVTYIGTHEFLAWHRRASKLVRTEQFLRNRPPDRG